MLASQVNVFDLTMPVKDLWVRVGIRVTVSLNNIIVAICKVRVFAVWWHTRPFHPARTNAEGPLPHAHFLEFSMTGWSVCWYPPAPIFGEG